MERMKASDFPQALLDLFNACVHGEARKLFGAPDVPTAAFAAFLEPAPPGVVEERFLAGFAELDAAATAS